MSLDPGAKYFGGGLTLGITDFIEIKGSFGFEETTATVNGVTIELPPGTTVKDGAGPLRVGQVVAIAARAEAGRLVAEIGRAHV